MKSLRQWLDEYSASHRHPINKAIHWICVPVIAFTVFGLLRAVPLGGEFVNAATVGGALALAYYLLLSWRLALGAALVFALMYAGVEASDHGLGGGHLPLMVAMFVLAWIFQFVGHKLEGAKPSFFKDLQFLLIGPLWLLAQVYRRLSLPTGEPRAAAA